MKSRWPNWIPSIEWIVSSSMADAVRSVQCGSMAQRHLLCDVIRDVNWNMFLHVRNTLRLSAHQGCARLMSRESNLTRL